MTPEDKTEVQEIASAVPSRFLFTGYEVDRSSGTLSFRYRFDGGPEFVETISYGASLPGMAESKEAALQRSVAMLYAVSGVSYYKLYAPRELDLGGLEFAREDIDFLHGLYFDGLGEFAHRNGLDLAERLVFTNWRERAVPERADQAAYPVGRSAVLVGGGKDSLVSVEAMRASGLEFDLFAVNPRKPMVDCAEMAGKELLSVQRSLSPVLFELNGTPGTYNGHVPITAIVSLIAVAGAFLHGYSNIVLSNERSADEANIRDGDHTVNHQFSKTSGFEIAFQQFLDRLGYAPLRYFSLLRPLSEIQIAQLFSRTDRYDHVFTSCNKAFRLNNRPDTRWCGDCAKCRFTFLLMALPMGKERLTEIFGTNLLDDLEQLEGFKELTGIDTHKPWDCVGEEREAITLLTLLSHDPEWQSDAVVRAMSSLLTGFENEAESALAEYLTPHWRDNMPSAFEEVLRRYVG